MLQNAAVNDRAMRLARASLRGPGAQPVLGIHSLFLGGALLEVQAPVAPGTNLVLDLVHPALGAVGINVRVAWCRPLAGSRGPVAALEFHGSWDGLIHLRHQLAAYLGSRVFDGPRFVGYVLREPNDPASACFDVSTAKIALILPLQGNRGYSVRWRDAPPEAPMPVLPRLDLALQAAFRLRHLPSLNVPGPARDEAATEPAVRSAEGARESPEEEALYGMNTVVLAPDRVEAEGLDEEAILGANTLVLGPEEGALKEDDSRVLGAGRVFGPKSVGCEHSRLLAGDELVGFVAPTGAEGSFNLYGVDGRKLALLARPESEGPVQVCMMGDKASESLEFFTADSFVDGASVALDLSAMPRLDPPLDGFA
ncbi:MAG: hypothetical protein D6731_11015 [Planctomycetota bacterium]|nr:MAG: hypothetical protein D6731_11015 [Planctomycetota bacterium]